MSAVLDPNTLTALIPTSAADATTPANAAFQRANFLARGLVLSGTTATPPSGPADGDGYIIPAGATGSWSGQEGRLAHRMGGVWQYYQPRQGYAFLVDDTGEVWVYEDGAWLSFLRPDHSVFSKGGTYSPTAADFLNGRLLKPSANLIVQCDSVALLAGKWYGLGVIRSGGFTVGFTAGSGTLLRGGGLAISAAGDIVTLAAMAGGTEFTVSGAIA